jgi:WD40 repeat protein
MVSIVPYENKRLTDLKLPSELISLIVKFGDISSYIIIAKDETCINMYDMTTLKLIKTIPSHPLDKIINMSVSKCGNYVVGSNETNVCIWNIKTSKVVRTIDVSFNAIYDEERDGEFRFYGNYYNFNGEPVHTFTSNNELLVACNSQIKSYYYNSENKNWLDKDTYTIPYETKITCITANKSENKFACGDLGGEVFIYNIDNQELLHEITTRERLMRSDHYPEITSIAFNQNIIVISSVGTNNKIVDLTTMKNIKIEQPQMDYGGAYFTLKNYMLTLCNTKFIGTYNNRTFVWNVITGKVIKQLDIVLENDCIMTLDGNKFVSYGWEKWKSGLRVFDYED